MQPLDVLVVDDDPWILEMVAKVVRMRGHRPHTALDGEEALRLARELKPQLVITDVMMPKMDGWTLVRSLRARSELAFVPVIFLTSLSGEDDRIYGFRLGADDYLAKPFRFEELDLRISNALRRQKDLHDARLSQASGSLAGSLNDFGLSTLLNMIDMEQKSGVLSVTRDNGEMATLYSRRGRIVAARIEGDDRIGPEVVYRLLTWSSGRFSLDLSEVEGEDEIGLSTSYLLLEGVRRIDELRQPPP